MGQLIGKLMSICGKQGKGSTGHPGDRFDPALTCPPIPPIWGRLGGCDGGPRVRRVLSGASPPAPQSPLPPPRPLLGGRALRCAQGRRVGRASFLRLNAVAGFLRL